MESCTCINCTGDNFHLEQMAEEIADKDSYMESRSPSIYNQLDELHRKLNSTRQKNKLAEIMDRVSALDTCLVGIALTCEDKKTTEKILEAQYILY